MARWWLLWVLAVALGGLSACEAPASPPQPVEVVPAPEPDEPIYTLQAFPGLSEVWNEVEARVLASRSTGLLYEETRAAVVLLLAADFARQWDEHDSARRLAIYALASIEGVEILDAVLHAPVLWPYVERANQSVPSADVLLEDPERWKQTGFEARSIPDTI